MKVVFALFNSLHRLALEPYGGKTNQHAQLRAVGGTLDHLRPPLCRQPALHARPPRHAHRPPELPAPQLGGVEPYDNSFAECWPSAASTAIWSPTISIISRMAASPITTATTSTISSAARRATVGRRWCSRTGTVCARCITSASSVTSAAPTRHRTSSIASSSARSRISVGQVFRRCHGIPRPQP